MKLGKVDNYEMLDDYLEELLERKIFSKSGNKKNMDRDNLVSSILLRDILELNLDEKAFKYVMDHLNKRGIRVGGQDISLLGEYKNYDYYQHVRRSSSSQALTCDDNRKLFEQLSKATTKEKKIYYRDKIAKGNMKLVEYIVYQFCMNNKKDKNDLLGYGYEGLMKAIDKFDLSYGTAFSSYAIPSINRSIISGIAELDGYKQGKFYVDYSLAKKKVLNGTDEQDWTPSELAKEIIKLLVEEKKIDKEKQLYIYQKILFTKPISLEEDVQIEEVIQIEEDEFKKIGLKELLIEMMDCYLTDREKDIVCKHYGIECDSKVLKEIAKELEISSERVRKIEIRALRKLRGGVENANDVKEYLR